MTYVNEDKRQVEQVVWFTINRDGSWVRADGYEPMKAENGEALFGPYVIAAPVPDEVLAEIAARRAANRLDGETRKPKAVRGATAKGAKA